MQEIFDIYDERGNWLGTADRSEVHAQGLWHHTIHCWLARPGQNGEALILFQKRSENKDTNPGSFDISAAGHLSAGETPEAAVRELEEELGIQVSFDELVPFGIIREEASGAAGGKSYIDREVSHVFCCVTSLSLVDFRMQEEEVAGLYEAEAEELIALMEGKKSSLNVMGVEIDNGRLSRSETLITLRSFVSRDYGYYTAVCRFLSDLVKKARQ
jgi:isopentenyldiphosphate isomerase